MKPSVRRLLRTVATGAAIAGLLSGTTACLGGGGSSGDDAAAAPAVRDGIATGAYPYVVACQVFTAADVRAITGHAADPMNIQGKYSAGFPRTAPQDMEFPSTCTRSPLSSADFSVPDVYEVSISQYPDTTMVKKMIKHPPKVRGSQIPAPGLARRFGAGAILNRGVIGGAAILSFFYQNKAVNVDITLASGSEGKLRAQAVKLGKRVLRRLRAGAGRRPFVMGPASGRLAGHRYFPPCKLLTLAGVQKVFRGQAVDAADIAFAYGEGLTHNTAAEQAIIDVGGGARTVYNILNSECVYMIGAGNSKFQLKLSAGQVFDGIPASEQTLMSPWRLSDHGEKVRGLGQAAKIATIKHEVAGQFFPELMVRYPRTLVRVGFVSFTGSKVQRVGYLRKIAQQLPARLPRG